MAVTAAPSRRQSGAAPAPAAVRAIPFTGAAHEHVESITTTTTTPGTTVATLGPFDVPAYGYLRHIFLEVSFTGGTVGAGTLSADYPWNALTNIQLLDVNGAPIFGPIDGYAAYQANVWGGYAYRQDPKLSDWYSATFNGSFFLRIPVEIARHSGLGALANQNAAASYKLSYSVNTIANIYAVAPTTPANVVVKSWLEAWSLPNETDLAGRPQAQIPPAHGTSQYWSQFIKSGIVVGANTTLLPRVGNLIRNIVVIARNGSGVRSDGVMPDPLTLAWDARILTQESQNYRRQKMMESLAGAPTRDTGVFAFPFNNLVLGHAGDEEANLWLPTVQSTRLELSGSSAVAGSLQIITNDIAPVEVIPSERFVETSASGFHPNVGQPVPAAQ